MRCTQAQARPVFSFNQGLIIILVLELLFQKSFSGDKTVSYFDFSSLNCASVICFVPQKEHKIIVINKVHFFIILTLSPRYCDDIPNFRNLFSYFFITVKTIFVHFVWQLPAQTQHSAGWLSLTRLGLHQAKVVELFLVLAQLPAENWRNS